MSFERAHQARSQTLQASSSTPQFAPRSSSLQEPKRLPNQEDIENEAFQQNKFEAFGLQLKEKHGTIIPVEQERLGVLQAKMSDFWAQRLERASRFEHRFANIPVHASRQQVSAPIMPRLTIQPHRAKVLLQLSQPAITPTLVGDRAIQAKGDTAGDRPDSSVEQRPNKTGMPDALKAGVESLSGYSLDNVRVHYHSPKPSQLQALAYTQGTEIHVASGQEEHLPHEAWHVVQQAQGRVQPTMQMKDGVPVNDDAGLEREADVMGAKAAAAGWHVGLSPLLQGQAELVEDATKGNRVNGQGEEGSLNFPSSATTKPSDFLHLQRRTGNQATSRAILNQTAHTVQRMEREKALKLLGEGIASLAARRRLGSPIDAYLEVRAFGPPEGLTTLEDYKLSELGKALGLTVPEEMALYAYSQPSKDNEQGEFYMGDHPRWEAYKTGWAALNGAVEKLPTLRDLNLTGEQVPTFRAEREDSLFMKRLAKCPCYILHGQRLIGDTGTRHFASASVMGSSVHMDERRTEGGSLRFECPSARFIQTFGGMSTAVDGGEVLIPPGMITYCDGKPHQGQFGPEYRLTEVGFETVGSQKLLNKDIPLIEDKDGEDITGQFDHLYVGGKGPVKSGGFWAWLWG